MHDVDYYCCGAGAKSEQQHNQDLREMYKIRWDEISKSSLFTRMHYIYSNQSELRHFLPECSAPFLTRIHCTTNNSNKNTRKILRWKRESFAAQTQSFLCGKFSTARLEVLPNLRHAGVFQISTMVNLGIGFQEPLTRPGVSIWAHDVSYWVCQ